MLTAVTSSARAALCAVARQQRRNGPAFKTSGSCQVQEWIIGGFGHPDPGVRSSHQSLGRCDVWPSLEQLRRHTCRNRRRRSAERERRKTEGSGRFANQSCNGMLVLGPEHSDVYCLGTGCLQLRLGLLDVNLGGNSSLKPALVQLQGLLILCDGRVQKLLLGIEAARLKVEHSQLRMHAQVNSCQVSSTGLRLLAIRLHIAAHSSPGVNFI